MTWRSIMFKKIWQGIKDRIFGTLLVLDEEGNVLWGKDPKVPNAGNPHYTISERLDEMRNNGSKFACVFCKILTWIAQKIFRSKVKDHCANSMEGMPQDVEENG